MKRGFALVTIAILVLALGTVAFVPFVRAQVGEVIKTVVLGAYSKALQVEFLEKSESRPLPADVWVISTDIGGFAGNAPPGVDPTVRSVASFEEAQAATDFHLRAPTDLPEGYALREANLAPIGGTHWAFLFYSGPGHDIVLVQMRVGPQPSDDPHVAISVVSGAITDGTLEEVDFDGRSAAWIVGDGHSLQWEVDGISYMLGGLDLSLEQTLQIARSIR